MSKKSKSSKSQQKNVQINNNVSGDTKQNPSDVSGDTRTINIPASAMPKNNGNYNTNPNYNAANNPNNYGNNYKGGRNGNYGYNNHGGYGNGYRQNQYGGNMGNHSNNGNYGNNVNRGNNGNYGNNANYGNYGYQQNQPQKNNGGLIAAVSVLGVLVVAVAVFLILWFSGIIGKTEKSVEDNTSAYVQQEEKKEEAPAPPTPAPEPVTMYVANVKTSIYFRSQPTEVDSNIICEIPLRTAISFIENVDAVFAKIIYNGQEGYVKREYLSSTMPAAPAPSAADGNTSVSSYKYIANVKNSVYFRSQPTELDSNIMGEIALGVKVGYIERTNNVFSKIYYNGKYGYVKTQYLSSSSPGSSSSSSASGGSVQSYVMVSNVKTSIYFRSSPSENSSNIICEIPVNTVVGFVERTNNVFSKIYYNGRYGYAKSEYLQ